MRIDAHQHFWLYSPAEYGWIEPSTMAGIARDFGPGDLAPHLTARGIDGCVAVQARQHDGENAFLLAQADEAPIVKAVVGWVDLLDPAVDRAIEHWVTYPRFKGVRHIVQAEAPGYLLQSAFIRGVERLSAAHLTYDILIHAGQLREAIAFVDRCPADAPLVLDHIAKPKIAAGTIEPWRTELFDLARRPNVLCKLSGMVTEADPGRWTPEGLRPYMDAVLEAFGPDRLMYGSDWPVCLLAGSYGQVYDLAASSISGLSPDEQAAIMGVNASRFYGLDPTS